MFGRVFINVECFVCVIILESLYFHLHSLSLAWHIQQILPLSRIYNKIYVKFQTTYKELSNKMNNTCFSTVTVQILHVLLSAGKYKTVYLLLTNFKADIRTPADK